MKHMILALTTLLFTTQAQARSVAVLETANLNRFAFQPGSDLASIEVDEAQVKIDYLNQEVTVSVQPRFSCPPNAVCAMVMPLPITYTAKLQSVSYNGCNQRVIEARTDKRLVDGFLTKITVTDSMPMVCDVFLPNTQVDIEIEGGLLQFNEKHHLSGEALKP